MTLTSIAPGADAKRGSDSRPESEFGPDEQTRAAVLDLLRVRAARILDADAAD